MARWTRRTFLNTGLAAGAGVIGARMHGWDLLAAAQGGPGFPDEILNPIEVTGDEAVPIVGRLPGARRMYVLPADQGEFHLVGSQVVPQLVGPGREHGVLLVLDEWPWRGRARAARALCARAADEEAEPHCRPRHGPDGA